MPQKIVVRPARHKIFSLHVGDEERFESSNLVFINGKWLGAEEPGRCTWSTPLGCFKVC